MANRYFTGFFIKIFYLISFTILTSLLCYPPSANAQTQIPCGHVLTGSISVTGEEDRYTFSASNGDVVHLRQSSHSNRFFIRIQLLSPNNQLLASSTGTITQALTQTGTYTIVAKFSTGTSQTGDYELIWQQIKNPCGYTQIIQCQTLQGSINSPADMDAYIFNGTVGQNVLLRLRELTTNFELPSRMELYDPDGILVVNTSRIINRSLSKTGAYTLIVGSDLSSGMAGNYTVTMGNIEVLLSTPNGGEVFQVGSTVTIKWLSGADNPDIASHNIFFSTDGGATFPIVVASGLPSFPLSYNWTIPSNLLANNGRIRIVAKNTAGSTCQDDSDASFIVTGLASATDVSYKYDELSRLTQTIYDDGTAITYTYDDAGNRLNEVVASIPFFRITCNSSTISVNKNASVSSTCTVTPLNGFSGIVSLSCVGMPSSTSCSFNPATLIISPNSTANTTLTINATLPAQTGVYSFQVKGTSGSITRTSTMILMVKDFTISCNPISLSLMANGTATSTCTITSLNEFNSAVTLSCSSAPAGVTCTLNPPAVTPSPNGTISSILTASAGSSVTLGTSSLLIRGTHAGNIRSFSIPLAVAAAQGGLLLLDENFSTGIPSDWTVTNSGSGGGSAATWTTANPCNRSTLAPFTSPLVIVDSNCGGSSATQDEQLITPTINASGHSQVVLEFSNQFRRSGAEVADVDVSTDGGTTWTNVLRQQGANDGFATPNTKSIDITYAIASNPSSVKIRFHYYNGGFKWWWAIDNVKVRGIP